MAYGVDSLSAFPFFTPTVFGNYFSRQYHTTVIRGIEIIYQRGGDRWYAIHQPILRAAWCRGSPRRSRAGRSQDAALQPRLR